MDTIGEFLTRIRNAGLARHEKLDVPASQMYVWASQRFSWRTAIFHFQSGKRWQTRRDARLS